MIFSAKQTSQILSAKLIGKTDNSFSEIATDSRTAGFATQSLFVAIKGERHNGHIYIKELYQQGCRCFLVSEEHTYYNELNDASFIRVENTLDALQKLAAYKRSLFNIPVVGITGSNGKTIVKEWLWQLLQVDYTVCKNPKSYNSQIGVPLSVWQLNEQHTFALFEAGISQPQEMKRLETIIKPTIGIMTNIGSAHDENFKNHTEKTNEKLLLFQHAEKIIYCKDYDSIQLSANNKQKLITWSFLKDADLKITSQEIQNSKTLLQAIYQNKNIELLIPFTDKASIENCIHCWLFMLNLNYANEIIQHRLLELEPLGMRLEMKQGINNCTLINDAYSNDIHSLSIALDFLQQQKQHARKVVILSDILQSGKNKEELYKEVNALLLSKNITEIIGIGKDIASQQANFSIKKTFFNSTEDFIAAHKKQTASLKDAVILIKGARSFGFERIHKLLQQKSHDTILEINLNNLVHNLNYYRSKLQPGVGIMPMVKAFSYGSGSFEIANALQHTHVNYFAVAYADEGVELRKNGITTPIMVMNPEVQSFEQLLQYNLEPEVFSFSILEKFAVYAKENNQTNFPVHLKIDTGMHRLGFEENDIPALIEKLQQFAFLQIKSIFSHLVASDDKTFDEFTQQQISLFEKLSTQISKALNYPILRHICNSGGITCFPQAHFNMVRLGIGLYGIGINAEEQKHLLNVSSLKTTISQIKKVNAGDTVGYSRKGKITNPTIIATVPIGYADGLNRKLGNGVGCLFVQGKPAPIVGNVCMDMCMIDVTNINANEGDEVVVFDDVQKIQSLAQTLETISYEILTSVSARVKRIYLQE